MPRSRKEQVSLEDTPYYHCVARCVRRAFLCGDDPITGSSYEHRRGWVEKRLHIDSEKAKNWSTIEVLEHWHQLHKGTLLTQRYSRGESLPNYLVELVETAAETYRQRLMDISWFMKELNEPIARRANVEDNCTGHFWEGRFKSQALLDEAALMACMAYVDLNPLRANMNKTPEDSDFTSVKRRVTSAKSKNQPKALYPFVGNPRKGMPRGLPFKLTDYLELIDMTGRIIREDKRGLIDTSLLPILKRLNISSENWLCFATELEKRTGNLVGQEHSIDHYCERHQRQRKPKRQSLQLIA